MGRRSKLTPELQATVAAMLEAGNYVQDICARVGISRETYYNWQAAGRNVRDTAPTDDENAAAYDKWRRELPAREARWLDFSDTVEKAHAEGTIGLLAQINLIGRGGRVVERTTTTRPDGTITEKVRYAPPRWQALAWILERRDFDRFGRRVKMEMTQESLEAELARLEAEAAAAGIDLGDL